MRAAPAQVVQRNCQRFATCQRQIARVASCLAPQPAVWCGRRL